MLKEISRGKLATIIVFGVIAVASTVYYSISNILFYNKTGQLASANLYYGTYGNANTSKQRIKLACLSMVKRYSTRRVCSPYSNEYWMYDYNNYSVTTNETYSSSTIRLFTLIDEMYSHTASSTLENSIERGFYAIQFVKKDKNGKNVLSVKTYENDSSSNKNDRSAVNTDFIKHQINQSDSKKVVHFHTHPYIPHNVQLPSPPDYDLEIYFVNTGVDVTKFVNYVVTKDYVIQYWVERNLTETQISRITNFSFITATYFRNFGEVCFNDSTYVDDPTTTADDQLFCDKVSERENVDPMYVTDGYTNVIKYRDSALIRKTEKSTVKQLQTQTMFSTLGLKTKVWTKEEFKRLTKQTGFYPDARPR